MLSGCKNMGRMNQLTRDMLASLGLTQVTYHGLLELHRLMYDGHACFSGLGRAPFTYLGLTKSSLIHLCFVGTEA